MRKRIVKSIVTAVICLGMVCEGPVLSVMAEETGVSEVSTVEEAGAPEINSVEEAGTLEIGNLEEADIPGISGAEEADISGIDGEEETPSDEKKMPEEELPATVQEDLSVSVVEESEAEGIPEEDAAEAGTENERLGESGTYKPYPDATYELKYEELEDGTLKITGIADGGTASGNLVIPDHIGGKAVTVIDNNAFKHCRGFNGSLTIPDSVTTIGDAAFDGCSGFSGSHQMPHPRSSSHCPGSSGFR